MDCPECSLSRRAFLKSGAVALAAFTIAPSFLQRAVAATPAGRGKVLVTIFQRGAADGLNIVVPFRDQGYYASRRSIAIAPPGGPDGAIDLDGFFGLHPALQPLKPIWDQGHLAAIQASGSPNNTRSHFDAQDYMETATPGNANSDGWLNRCMSEKKDPQGTPFRAVAISPVMPHTLQGPFPAVAMPDVESFAIRDKGSPVAARSFEGMYDKAVGDVLANTGRETFDAIKMLQDRVAKNKYQPANGASYPKGKLGKSLSEIARLIKGDVGLEVAFTDCGGWDNHANQGGAKGQMAARLTELAQALSAFYQDMGDRMGDVVVLTMTEFGRMVKENGSLGTDHGHASCNFVMGGPVAGRKVYGQWPGLAQEQLYEGRDLAVTTDFRTVFSEVASRFLNVPDMQAVFPGFNGPGGLGFIRPA